MKTPAVLAGSLIVLTAAYTGTAWYVGMEAENAIKNAVEHANQRITKAIGPDMAPVTVSIAIEEYRRGVFSSNARYSLFVHNGGERTELAFEDHMQHGPFPWGLLRHGELSPQLAYSRSQLVDTDAVKRWFDAARGAMPLQADTRIGFGGSGVSTWQFAPLEWVTDEDSLSFSGGTVVVELDNGFRDSNAHGNFGSLVLGSGPQGDTVALKNIGIESRTRSISDDSVEMQSRVQVDGLIVDAMAADSLHLDAITVAMDSTQKGALLDAALRYDIKSIRIGDIDLGRVSMGGKLNSFNFEAFSGLMAEYEAIAHEHGAENGEDFDLTSDDEKRLLARLVPVLASSPEVVLEPVSWGNEEGESRLALNLSFQPLPAGDPQAQEEALADALQEAHFELALSRPMLLQVVSRAAGGGEEGQQFEMFAALIFDNYVAQLQNQGLVRIENDRTLLSVHYENGQLNVNGEAMAIDEFMVLLAEFGL